MLRSALSVFLISCLLGRLACTVQRESTVKRGEDATLNCYGPTDATTILLRWEKPDLKSDLYVFFFRDDRPNEKYQLPYLKGRVNLKDPEWKKNGDFTVILKNVSMNDAGIYECHAGYNKQKPELRSSINLKVEEPGQTGRQSGDGGKKKDGGEKSDSVGLIVGLSVLAVFVLVVVVGFIIYKKHPNQSNPDYQPPPGQEILPVSS